MVRCISELTIVVSIKPQSRISALFLWSMNLWIVKVYTKLDIRNAYHCIRIAKDDGWGKLYSEQNMLTWISKNSSWLNSNKRHIITKTTDQTPAYQAGDYVYLSNKNIKALTVICQVRLQETRCFQNSCKSWLACVQIGIARLFL